MSDANKYDEQLLGALADKLAPFAGKRLGVAVSGGSDSRALLELLKDWARENDSVLFVATVDHGLRAEAQAEAESVAAVCRSYGIEHKTLVWENWDGKGNLQAQARSARYALLAAWSLEKKLAGVALGHTADDVAETFLMRLSRAAGVDGLARMRSVIHRNGAKFIRPMLDLRRGDLRGFLEGKNLHWIEDPSNQDTQFERVKMRESLANFAELGLSVEKISQSAEHLEMASKALQFYAVSEAKTVATVRDCSVELDNSKLTSLPQEIQRRLINAAIKFVTMADFSPRSKSLLRVMERLPTQGVSTLSGCVLSLKNNTLLVTRELAFVEEEVKFPASGGLEWDRRWRLIGDFGADAMVRPLGVQGLSQCPNWRDSGRMRLVLLSSPSVWRGKTLLAAPLAQSNTEFGAEPLRTKEDFALILLSH